MKKVINYFNVYKENQPKKQINKQKNHITLLF